VPHGQESNTQKEWLDSHLHQMHDSNELGLVIAKPEAWSIASLQDEDCRILCKC
jgi:hypothetical protein